MAAEHPNATVAAVRIAARTADIRRDLMAEDPMDNRAAGAGIEAAVHPIAGLAVAVGDIAAVVVAVRAEVAAVLMRPHPTVAAENPTAKVVRLLQPNP
jgi:hypothetical protein